MMKSLILCAFLSFVSYGKVIIKKDNNFINYEISVDKIIYKEVSIENYNFIETRLSGINNFASILYEPGKPEIPAISFFIDGAKNINVKIKFQEKYFKKLDKLLKPSLFSIAKIPGNKKILTIDKSVYSLTIPYPTDYYKIKYVGTIRGIKRHLITLYPLKYIASQNIMTGIPTFFVEVELYKETKKDKPRILFIVGDKFKENKKLLDYQNLLKNFDFESRSIIVNSKIDTPDKIKNKIQAFYSKDKFLYAIIIGDINDVPAYNSSIIWGETDHYYRCLDEPYENDIGTPDIGLGRIAVETNEELDTVIDKAIKYRTRNFDSLEWIKNLSFIASDDPNFWDIAEGSHNYAIDNYTAPLGYLGDFPNLGELGGDKLYAITYSVNDATTVEKISAGRSLINYGGHGAIEYWAGPTVTKNDVLNINHPDALPVVISNACVTGNFEYDSFAETWLRHKNGAIMFWGSIDSTYWDEDDILERAMYDALYKDNKLIFSDFTDYALSEVWKYYGGEGKSKYYWETYALFGDPAISILTNY